MNASDAAASGARFVLVPVEPTDEQCDAGVTVDIDSVTHYPFRISFDEAAAIYRAMLAAAPKFASDAGAALRSMLQEAHDTLHECTAVLHADDCRKVAAVMERIRKALATDATDGATGASEAAGLREAQDLERLATALEGVQERCRRASAQFNADKSVPSVRQMIALDSISGHVAHHLAGIELVRANAAALDTDATDGATGASDAAGLREALEEIIAQDDDEATISDLMQHDRNAGYLTGVRDCANIARAALTHPAPSGAAGEDPKLNLATTTTGGDALEQAARECQAVWRCAIGDFVGAMDVLKGQWEKSRRKQDREAGARLASVLNLLWAARDPAPGDYSQAAANGQALIDRVRRALSPARDGAGS